MTRVSSLVGRTIAAGQPTVIRLEASYWDALDEIAAREGWTVEQICTDIRDRIAPSGDATPKGGRTARGRSTGVSLANGIRAFVVGYFRQAATEQGHGRAGHGNGTPFARTPFSNASGSD